MITSDVRMNFTASVACMKRYDYLFLPCINLKIYEILKNRKYAVLSDIDNTAHY